MRLREGTRCLIPTLKSNTTNTLRSSGNIHSEVFAIFSLLCGMEGRRSEAIFFALKSDASQRDITLAIINEVVSEQIRNKAKKLTM